LLIPHPDTLAFDGLALPDALSITIDRAAAREILDWTDDGPHPTFADIPEQRTTITIARKPAPGDLTAPLPAQLGELSFIFSPAGTDAARKRLRAQCVVREVRHDLASPRQFITLLALSPHGSTDPIVIEEA
jgi:hypothetical protein